VAAGAYVERVFPHEVLVVLDTDTLILREPTEFMLPPDVDVAVRPVDVKGMCTSGPTDPSDAYWRDLCRCCGADYDQIPWIQSFVDRCRVKASYNAGLAVVRGGLGILQRCAEFFFASLRANLEPSREERRFRTSGGWVEGAGGRLWGSSQAALSLAIWSTTRQVRELKPTYNYPLHMHGDIDQELRRRVFPDLVHVHYHWLLDDPATTHPLCEVPGPLSPEQRAWLSAHGSSYQEAGL